MVKRWVFSFGLACCLISLSFIKPALVKAEIPGTNICKCELDIDTHGSQYCRKEVPGPSKGMYELFECEAPTGGGGLNYKCGDCQLRKNSSGKDPNHKLGCKCNPLNGQPIKDEMYCNDNPISIAKKTSPVCTENSTGIICECLTDREIHARNVAGKSKSVIENGIEARDPFCTEEGFGVKNPDGTKRDLSPTYKGIPIPGRDTVKIRTALGCIPVDFIQVVAWIFEKGFGIVGGIAFILLIGAFIQLATSEGDTKKIQGAKEMITSTVTGLLLAIFSIFIIRLLMVTILRIPGLQ